MASVRVTLRYTTVALHAVAIETRAQKQESAACSGRAGVARGAGSRASASSMAAEDVQRTGSHGQSVPKLEPLNQSSLSRLLRQPSLLEKAAHALAERRHTRSSVKRQLVTVVQAHAVLWSSFRTWRWWSGQKKPMASEFMLVNDFRQCIRIDRQHPNGGQNNKLTSSANEEAPKAAVRPVFPEDGGLSEDAVADASGLLPDSSFTRML